MRWHRNLPGRRQASQAMHLRDPYPSVDLTIRELLDFLIQAIGNH